MTPQVESTLLTPAEVSQILRISLSSVYAAAAAGRIPPVTLWRGRRKSLVRFRKSDIDRIAGNGDGTRPEHGSRGARGQ